MKRLFFFFAFTYSVFAHSQNIGINKATPNHPLDVNGNINIDGKIVVNNAVGKAGEVLTTNSSGNTVWSSLADFKYAVNYSQDGTFTIPVGVTRIAVELWGGGGGGAAGGGGGGGMYVLSFQDVTPGVTLTVNVGDGGSRATTSTTAATNGSITTVSGPSFVTVNALGGNGASSTLPGYGPIYSATGQKYIQYPGQSGDPTTFSYQQKNSTTFAIVRKYGDGGASRPDYTKRNVGQTISVNENNGVQIEANFTSFAPVPGGGGGGGISSSNNGANGMVVIRY